MRIRKLLTRFRENTGLIMYQEFKHKTSDKYILKCALLTKVKQHLYKTGQLPYLCKWEYLQTIYE